MQEWKNFEKKCSKRNKRKERFLSPNPRMMMHGPRLKKKNERKDNWKSKDKKMRKRKTRKSLMQSFKRKSMLKNRPNRNSKKDNNRTTRIRLTATCWVRYLLISLSWSNSTLTNILVKMMTIKPFWINTREEEAE